MHPKPIQIPEVLPFNLAPPILRVIHGQDTRALSVSYTATRITNLRIRSNRSVNFFENT